MDFYEVLEQVLVLLQRHGRVSYRALKRQFNLDDDFIEDLKDELLHSRHPVVDEDGRSFVWTGDTAQEPTPTISQPNPPAADQERDPVSYTPQHLADKTLTSRSAMEGERSYQQALAQANELGMRPLQAHCHRGLGTVYCQRGQSEKAQTELSTAIEMYRDMEMTFWLPETQAALAALEKR